MKRKKILLRTIVTVVLIIGTTASLQLNHSFANKDIKITIRNWYEKRLEDAISYLEAGINKEVDIQIQYLEKEIEDRMDFLHNNLINYTESQKLLHKESIKDYADTVLESISFSNEEDKIQVRDKLEEILTSAQRAMDELAESYIPEKLAYIPSGGGGGISLSPPAEEGTQVKEPSESGIEEEIQLEENLESEIEEEIQLEENLESEIEEEIQLEENLEPEIEEETQLEENLEPEIEGSQLEDNSESQDVTSLVEEEGNN